MAPPGSKKGSKNNAAASRDRRSSSRQSTPLSTLGADTAPPTPLAATPTSVGPPTPAVPKETGYINMPTASLINTDPSIEALIEKAGGSGANPPSGRNLMTLQDRLKDSLSKVMQKRGEMCERGLRQIVAKKKEREKLEKEQQEAEQTTARIKEEEAAERKKKKNGKKRSADDMEGVETEGAQSTERRDSMPSVGAHGVARQDGVGVHEGTSYISLSHVLASHRTLPL
jgi:transcriptional adapter 3